ncbi:hypothetical protein P7C71_g6383, partial [Lecanoromycetidae sp. Uapishka_2]
FTERIGKVYGDLEKEKEQAASKKKRADEAKTQLEDTQGQVTSLQENLQTQKASSETEKKRADESEETVEELQTALERVNGDLKKEQERVTKERNRADEAEKQRSEARDKVETLQKGLEDEKQTSQCQASRAVAAETNFVDAEEQVQALAAQLEKEKERSRRRKTRADLAETKQSEAETLSAALQTEKDDLLADIETKTSIYEQLGSAKVDIEFDLQMSAMATQNLESLLFRYLSATHGQSLAVFDKAISEDITRLLASSTNRLKSITANVEVNPAGQNLSISGRSRFQFPQPDLIAAIHMWISVQSGQSVEYVPSLFRQATVTPEQQSLLPWIRSALDLAIEQLGSQPSITPTITKTLFIILQGLLWLRTNKSSWPVTTAEDSSEDESFKAVLESMLTSVESWMNGLVDKGSFLMALYERVKDNVLRGAPFDTWLTPSMLSDYPQCISTNSDLPADTYLIFAPREKILLLIVGEKTLVFDYEDISCIWGEVFGGLGIEFKEAAEWVGSETLRISQQMGKHRFTLVAWTRENLTTPGSLKTEFRNTIPQD